VKVEVRLFGIFDERAETSKLYFEDIADTDALLKRLHDCYPSLTKSSVSISVNHNIIRENTRLDDGDEIAFMPPFSGG
jgi:molybdopterin converting factor small subunit